MTSGSYTDILKRRGFFCFFWTQFLGAFNDNFYKIIITLVALDIPDSAGGGKHFVRVDADTMKYDRKLIDKSDV